VVEEKGSKNNKVIVAVASEGRRAQTRFANMDFWPPSKVALPIWLNKLWGLADMILIRWRGLGRWLWIIGMYYGTTSQEGTCRHGGLDKKIICTCFTCRLCPRTLKEKKLSELSKLGTSSKSAFQAIRIHPYHHHHQLYPTESPCSCSKTYLLLEWWMKDPLRRMEPYSTSKTYIGKLRWLKNNGYCMR
jgi:hypothetical protein